MKIINPIYRTLAVILVAILCLFQLSCKKDWLDVKPNKSLVVPATIKDYQAILDNNTSSSLFNFKQESLNEVSAGDFYLLYNTWQTLVNAQERNSYLWSADVFAGESCFDWNNAYTRILNENIVLEGIAQVAFDQSNKTAWNNVQGTALFYRAYDFFCLEQQFGQPYDPNTAVTDLGIPLRIVSDINFRSTRATVKETYDKIISDLLAAESMLPATALYPTRPGKVSVFGLLSRVYLSSNNYDKAFLYADSCLQIANQVLDYNTISTTATTPIAKFNKEVIYHHSLSAYSAFNNSSPGLIVDSNLYNSYASNDLRKKIFFKTTAGKVTYKGSYSGTTTFFGGIATDEIYLNRAECFARKNNATSAMNDLNTVLSKRWLSGTFVPFTAISADDALSQILTERRKELIFRGIRWSDLRRLNKDPKFAVTLKRVFNGQTYTLLPNSNLYTFPIPPDEIALTGIQQNPR